jgi:hypothetical protein
VGLNERACHLILSLSAFVSPGHGKLATRRRNYRRRLKRQRTSESDLPFKISATNLQLLGARPGKFDLTATVPLVAGAENTSHLTAFGRRKKSNRRVPAKLPEKIMFSENGADDISSAKTTVPGNSLHRATETSPFAFPVSLTTSRETQGRVPRNVFVTSIDAEEVPRDTQHKDCTVAEGRICCVNGAPEGPHLNPDQNVF